MLTRLRRDLGNISLPLIQLGLVFVALRLDRDLGTLTAIALLLLTGLYGWWRSLRHAHLIADTPTARIASAAQGYTELRGRGRPLAGPPLRSPINGLPVLWYRVVTERRRADGKWYRAGTQESEVSFLLDDGSGECAVDPEGAKMLVKRRDVFPQGQERHTQWSLIEHDPLYVIGEFSTVGSISPQLDTSRQVGELLADWKTRPQELLERFDLDGDGEISLQEWELARAQARREVLARQREVLAAPEAHVMRKPAGRRLYLISDLDPQRLARRYRWWALFHLLVFFGAVVAAALVAALGEF